MLNLFRQEESQGLGTSIQNNNSNTSPFAKGSDTAQNPLPKGVIETVYMQEIIITRYPNGQEFTKVKMWKRGSVQKQFNKKPKKAKEEPKIQKAEAENKINEKVVER